jgi:hypothetical protein
MASDDVLALWPPQSGEPYVNGTNVPTPDTRNTHPLWDFNDSGDTYLYFTARLPPWYTSLANISARMWAGFTTDITSGHTAYLNVYLYRMTDTSLDSVGDIDYALFGTGIVSASTTSGRLTALTINMTAVGGVGYNTFQPGDWVRLQLSRMGANAIDDAVGDMELRYVALYET